MTFASCINWIQEHENLEDGNITNKLKINIDAMRVKLHLLTICNKGNIPNLMSNLFLCRKRY